MKIKVRDYEEITSFRDGTFYSVTVYIEELDKEEFITVSELTVDAIRQEIERRPIYKEYLKKYILDELNRGLEKYSGE